MTSWYISCTKIFINTSLLQRKTHFPNTLIFIRSEAESQLMFPTDLNFAKFGTPFKIYFNQEFLGKGCKIVKGRVRCERSEANGKSCRALAGHATLGKYPKFAEIARQVATLHKPGTTLTTYSYITYVVHIILLQVTFSCKFETENYL